MLRRKGNLRLSPPLPMSMYTGLITQQNETLWRDGFPLLLSAVEGQCNFIALSAQFEASTQTVFRSRKWMLQSRLNRCLQLEDSESLWNGYSQSLRRKLRRAEDSGLRLDTDPPVQLLAECYGKSYQRHGVKPPISVDHMQAWLTTLRKQGILDLYAAKRADGRCVATRAMIRDGDTLYDWLAGSDPPLAPSGSHWLLHVLLSRYLDAGCRRFDFMGANTPGVSDFKRSFGGLHVEYQDLEWYRPTLLRHVNQLRSRLRQRQRGLT